MPVELLTALVSSIVGGLLVATANYLFTRKKTEAETEKLKAEAEKTRVETAKLIAELQKLSVSVQQANDLRKSVVDEKIIYDSSQGTDVLDFQDFGVFIEGKDKSEIGRGAFTIRQNILAIERMNLVGVYGVVLNRYFADGKAKEFISRDDILSGNRKFRYSFDAKVTKGSSVVQVEFREFPSGKDKSIQNKTYRIAKNEWTTIHMLFKVPPTVDCRIRIMVVMPSEINTTLLRNMQLAERYD